jgi:hypothetical protein
MVTNPDYAAWADFTPGSYVTFEAVQATGEQEERIRVTEKLVTKNPERVILQRTVEALDDPSAGEPLVTPRVEQAQIDPADDPRTHPDAVIRTVGEEDITVAGRSFTCEVKEVEVHATFDGLVKSMEDVKATVHVHPDMPGNLVKLHLKAKTPHHQFEMAGQAVDFKVVAARED